MTDLELFESLRPDVEPLTERDRARVRHDLFGGDAPIASSDPRAVDAAVHCDLDRGLVRSDARHTSGGRGLLSLAAACLVVVGIAAVWFTVDNRQAEDSAPAQQPSSTTPESTPTTSIDPTGRGVVIDMSDHVDDATGVVVWDAIRVAPGTIGWFDATTGVPAELVDQRRLASGWSADAISNLFACIEWSVDDAGPICERLAGGNGIEHVDYGDSLGIGVQLGDTDVRSQLWNQAYGQLWGYETIAEIPAPTEIVVGDITGLSYRVDDHAYLAWQYAPDVVVWLHARGLTDEQLATIAAGVEPVQLPDQLPLALELRPPGYTTVVPQPGDSVDGVPLLVASNDTPRLRYGTLDGEPCVTFRAPECRSVAAAAMISAIDWNDHVPDRLVAIAPTDSGLVLRTTSVAGTVTDNSLTATGLGFDLATWTPDTDEHLLSAALVDQTGQVVADTGELGETSR